MAFDFESKCWPIYHMRFMKKDDARQHDLKPYGRDAEPGTEREVVGNHFVSSRFTTDNTHKEPIADVGVVCKGEGNNEYYIITTSPGTDMTFPYSINT